MQKASLVFFFFLSSFILLSAQCVSGDCFNGNGTFLYPNGAIYVGDFVNGEIHGTGICTYPDGSQYQGQWAHRYPDGRGTKKYGDGTSRTGLWSQGRPVDSNGQILDEWMLKKEVQNDGTAIQSGCIQGNCENGEGIYAYPDGSKYQGLFYNQKPDGRGIFFYPNGDRYQGEFKNGYPHGEGTMYHAAGGKKSGRWFEGEFLLNADTNVNKTIGCIQGNCLNGFGNYIFKDGAKYTGPFRNGVPEGKGTVIYKNGERYEGFMSKGAFEGQGTYFMANGIKMTGNWSKGTYLGGVPAPIQPSNKPQLKVWALIIGISGYSHMPALRYPDDDAYRIFAFLQSPSGGAIPEDQIRILIDEAATKDNIKNAMKEIFWKAGPNDLVFMYFSGHGLKGAFLPIDFDGTANKLYHEEVVQILDKSPAKYKLCIADACHSGSLLALKGGTEPSVFGKYYESLANAKAGTALIMSSKSDETSLESSGLRQGVFTHFLIRGMKGEADSNGDKIVNVQELYNYVYTNVREYTGNRQSPIIRGDYDHNMTVGVKQ
ncbi:MAG: caspase family protein [Saprospiraceae bacterium]|nr:caspase family protein [Saprospiraceae bacterium]MCB9324539.1 caspase family protein [Lewinellaceae bacterium]